MFLSHTVYRWKINGVAVPLLWLHGHGWTSIGIHDYNTYVLSKWRPWQLVRFCCDGAIIIYRYEAQIADEAGPLSSMEVKTTLMWLGHHYLLN